MPESRKVLRQSLWPLSFLWAAIAALRHWAFDVGWKRIEKVGVPVISVGNLSVGGTGKTPMVSWLVERLRSTSLEPAVVARGYGRAEGAELNDEGLLLDSKFEGLVQQQDPNRVLAARRAIERGGVDVIVLDDGFQHRRLHRDTDIVLLDAMRPFAGGLCLPAGDLRETPGGLRRADLVVLTRAERLSDEAFRVWTEKLRRTARNESLPVFRATHAPVSVRLPGGSGSAEDPSALRGRRVLLLSGIGRPKSFEQTILGLGATVVGHVVKPDHHLHSPSEIEEFLARAETEGALPVTTEKDHVKLGVQAPNVGVLQIGLRFLGAEPSLQQLGLATDAQATVHDSESPEEDLSAELHE